MQLRRDRPGLWRSIRLTLTDPWQLFGTVGLIAMAFAFVVLLGNTRHPGPQSSRTGQLVTIVVTPSPQPLLHGPTASATPIGASSVQASQPANSRPRSSPSRSPRPTATNKPTARASPTPTASRIPPLAVLHLGPLSGNTPLLVTADAGGSRATAGSTIATYVFDFGDGSSVSPQSAPVATHLYSAAGVYTVTLTVTDASGLSSKDTASVTVAP